MTELDHFFALSLDMMWTTTLDGNFKHINPAVTRTLGYRESALRGRNLGDVIHAEERQSTTLRMAELAKGNPIVDVESRFRCADGSYKWIAWNGTPDMREGAAYMVARDRTTVRLLEDRCVCAIESTSDAFFAVDRGWRLIRINQQAERLWKHRREEVLDRNLWDVFPEAVDGPFHKLYAEVLRTGRPAQIEEFYPYAPLDRWFEVHAYPSAEGLAVYFRDVSERHQAEERIKRSLVEKELLLREVHHRVKNNLQVICSMLRLQSRQLQDETLLQVLRDCRERVLAMALLHDQLHRAKDLSNINLGEYIRSLAASLFCSYGVNSSTVGLEMDVEDITVAIDTAIPCGLIVNEIVSNSLRHAFPEGSHGCVSLGLHAAPGGKAELTVSDDGRGFPEKAQSGNSRSLGLRLVDLLAEQIDATVERSSQAGTQYRLVFQAMESKETKADE